jgi:hypothetical protein
VLKAEGTYEEDRNRRIEKRKAMKAAMEARGTHKLARARTHTILSLSLSLSLFSLSLSFLFFGLSFSLSLPPSFHLFSF